MAEVLLYAALDHNDQTSNINLAERLSTETGNFGFKVNLDHVLLWGLSYVDSIQGLGKPTFVDLKMNNGSRTMRNVVEELVKKGVRHTNVWAGAERLIRPLGKIVEGSGTELLGVTITTHFNEEYCQRYFKRSLPETVRMWAEVALDNGCTGVIVPGTTLNILSDLSCSKLVPAIRPDLYVDKSINDQEQPVTPSEAVNGGASYLVCGSPIYKSSDPNRALREILEEIKR